MTGGGRGVFARESRFLHAPSLALRLSRNDTGVGLVESKAADGCGCAARVGA